MIIIIEKKKKKISGDSVKSVTLIYGFLPGEKYIYIYLYILGRHQSNDYEEYLNKPKARTGL